MVPLEIVEMIPSIAEMEIYVLSHVLLQTMQDVVEQSSIAHLIETVHSNVEMDLYPVVILNVEIRKSIAQLMVIVP